MGEFLLLIAFIGILPFGIWSINKVENFLKRDEKMDEEGEIYAFGDSLL